MAPEIEVVTVRTNDPRAIDLTARGWVVVARSWGARLAVHTSKADRLAEFISRVEDDGFRIQELDSSWACRVLELDASTSGDYPAGPATTHVPLDQASAGALWSDGFRVFGAVATDSVPERVVGLTVVFLDGSHAETEFTVVSSIYRRRGIAAAVKAESILTLSAEGATVFGTGGSTENTGMLAVNARLGYVVTEEWATFSPGSTSTP